MWRGDVDCCAWVGMGRPNNPRAVPRAMTERAAERGAESIHHLLGAHQDRLRDGTPASLRLLVAIGQSY